MILSKLHPRKRRGAAILEYVIIAVGIAIFCTFGILMFGKAAQGQVDAATNVMSGSAEATDQSIHSEAQSAAAESTADSTGRTGADMGRN
jgi:type IV secretory pathway VirB6-like protein